MYSRESLGALPALIVVLLLLVSCSNERSALRPYSSDGCSSFPDGTLAQKNLWLGCCQQHDYAYWKGGTRAQRLAADLELQQCVSAVGEPEIAALMLAGVRVGGSPYLPSTFRWGYGWPYFRPYGELSAEELELALSLTPACVAAGKC